ncbi:LytR/AlgR family response regulator transcription factor [Ekhidna sp.]|uniref:LytR/AlgR family response regulator transcription factor n=1 Tax=Ekhidna sp. TaxID=2608089 RepID=UPI0035147666
MKCVAIDDEVHALKVIEMHADKVDKLEMVATFTNPVQAADFLEKNRVDLIFLDINMQSLNGFELLETLTHKPKVIFTTAYSEYAVKSYAVDALDYLMKPIAFSRFLKAVNKVEYAAKPTMTSPVGNASEEEKIISVKSGTTIHRINLQDILYLEADGNYTKFVTDKESIMVLCTMKDALAKVDDRFIQTHRSYAVSTAKVNKVEVHQLKIGEKVIPIGSSFRKEVMERFQ